MRYEILGDDMQMLVMTLEASDKIRAEAGAMMYMNEAIQFNTEMTGGLFKSLGRLLIGESFFLSTFTAPSGGGKVSFAAPYPGKIHVFDLKGESVICQKDAFLCCYGDVDLTVAFNKRLGAGFFGGEGFILQRISGTGSAFIHAGGTLITETLGPGEVLRVDTGCLVAFDDSVSYDIQMAGSLKTSMFGGEGLFLARMTGPGRVLLQTLPFSRLANRIYSAVGGSKEDSTAGGGLLGRLGSMLGGDRS